MFYNIIFNIQTHLNIILYIFSSVTLKYKLNISERNEHYEINIIFAHVCIIIFMNKRITIKDIARELNIHHSTVSRALRNDPRVNEKTRDQVLAFAREHGYQTNMNAVQLRGTRNNAIALIVPNINHSFFSDVVSTLTNLAYEKGYVISVFQSNEKYMQEKEIINTIIQHDFAGVIVSIAKDTVNSDHFRLLEKFGIPLVFFDRVCEDIESSKVLINNLEIVFDATEYLISKGYKRIAHITGTTEINVFRDRHRAYLAAIQKYNLEYKNALTVDEDFTVQLGKDIFKEWLNSENRPDAVISSSIHISMGILMEARKHNIKIPENLGLITFGTFMNAEALEPQISSIEQPENEIAELSFELLEKLMNRDENSKNYETRQVKATLIIRESC